MKMLRLLFPDQLLILMIIILFISGPVSAQENMTVAELTKKSDLVVIGKVNSVESEWNDSKTRIYSKVSIAVSELIKGANSGNEISIMQPGGEVGDVGEIYSDIPRFNKSENVLLFLERDKNNNLRVTGGMDGKYPVTINKSTGEKLIGGRINMNSFISEIKKNELQH